MAIFGSRSGTFASRREKQDGFNYKPLPLRWQFLVSLFTTLCCLLALLEYGRRYVPITDGPGTIPSESPVNPMFNAFVGVNSIPPGPTNAPIVRRAKPTSAGAPEAPPQALFPNETATWSNGTALLLNGSISARILRLDPSAYAGYSGPTVRLTSRCLWEPGPEGQRPVKPHDKMGTEVPQDYHTCWYGGYRLWYSNGPPDCAYDFTYYDPDGKFEFKPWSADDWDQHGWNLLLTEARTGCEIPSRCRERCPAPGPEFAGAPYNDWRVFTTTFRMLGPVVTTRREGGSDVVVTTEAAFLVTATKRAGESLWVPTASATATDSPDQTPTPATGARVIAPPGATLVTMLGEGGRPTATITGYVETLRGADGVPTATRTRLQAPAGPSPTTWAGAPPLPDYPRSGVFYVSGTIYFVGMFLPTLLAVLLSIPVQILSTNLKLMLPFYALARPGGASAADSVCRAPGNAIAGLGHSIRQLYRFGDPLSLLGDILLLSSTLLTSVSPEALGFRLSGKCHANSLRGCVMSLGIFSGPFWATETFIAFMMVIVALLAVSLLRARSGVLVKPWSIAFVAALLQAEETRTLLKSTEMRGGKTGPADATEALGRRWFALRNFRTAEGNLEYGVVAQDSDPPPLNARTSTTSTSGAQPNTFLGRACSAVARFFARDRVLNATFLVVLCGLFILILYYEVTTLNTPFERFFDSQKFGIRFFFAGFGAIITICWENIFTGVARTEAYRALYSSRRTANDAVFTSPATTPFTGLWTSLGRRSWFSAAVALMAILSKFTPVLLTNVPYRIVQTWTTHEVCTWMALAVLALMMAVLVWSLFVPRPPLPAGSDTLAAAMHYVCDSRMLPDFAGMASAGKAEWESCRAKGERAYRFGEMVGVSGAARIGVDYAEKEGWDGT